MCGDSSGMTACDVDIDVDGCADGIAVRLLCGGVFASFGFEVDGSMHGAGLVCIEADVECLSHAPEAESTSAADIVEVDEWAAVVFDVGVVRPR